MFFFSFYRSLVANLGAANYFTMEHFDNPKMKNYVEKAKIIYTAVWRSKIFVSVVVFLNSLFRDFSIQFVRMQWCISANMLMRIRKSSRQISRHHLYATYSAIDWWIRWCMSIIYLVMRLYVEFAKKICRNIILFSFQEARAFAKHQLKVDVIRYE